MKRLLKIIIYVFVFFIIYFLELYIFDNFKIAGIKPNIFLIMIIILSLYNKPQKSFIISLIVGLTIDVLNSKSIGLTAISFGILGYIISSIEKMFSIESKLSLIIFIFIGTFSSEIINYFLQVFVYRTNLEIMPAIKIITIESIYNVLLIMIFYPLCRKILRMKTEEIQENRFNGYLKRMR